MVVRAEYVYYRCTRFRAPAVTPTSAKERLADLLGDVIRPIQITADTAEEIATALRHIAADVEQHRRMSLQQLKQADEPSSANLIRDATTSLVANFPTPAAPAT